MLGGHAARPKSSPGQLRTPEQSLRLRRIFEETHDLAWRMLRRFGIPLQHLEDSFQQVYLITSERLDDIVPGSERAFVYGVALRLARGYRRTRGREVLGDEPDLHAGMELSADLMVDRNRLVEVCDQLLEKLSSDLRETFVLHEIAGLSGSEIAGVLQIPEGTVHSRLRRARLRMRREVLVLQANVRRGEVHRG